MHHTAQGAVTTRFGETPALAAELRVHSCGPGGIRTRDLVIVSDVVPPAFVTAFYAPGDKILRDDAELRDWASREASNPRPPAERPQALSPDVVHARIRQGSPFNRALRSLQKRPGGRDRTPRRSAWKAM